MGISTRWSERAAAEEAVAVEALGEAPWVEGVADFGVRAERAAADAMSVPSRTPPVRSEAPWGAPYATPERPPPPGGLRALSAHAQANDDPRGGASASGMRSRTDLGLGAGVDRVVGVGEERRGFGDGELGPELGSVAVVEDRAEGGPAAGGTGELGVEDGVGRGREEGDVEAG